MRYILLILFLISVSLANAQDSLLCKLEVTATYFTTDQYLNIYFINDQNEVVKYNVLTKDSITYSNKQLGTPTYIDAANPLKLLVLYPDFSSVVLLDSKLSEITILKFNSIQTGSNYKPIAACRESEGDHFWIYDELSTKLIQFDEQGNIVNMSEPFHELMTTIPVPKQLISANQKIYLTDPFNGIYIFDLFSNLQSIIEVPANSWYQIINDQIVFVKDNRINSTDLRTGETGEPALATDALQQVNIQPNTIFYRNSNTIECYRIH